MHYDEKSFVKVKILDIISRVYNMKDSYLVPHYDLRGVIVFAFRVLFVGTTRLPARLQENINAFTFTLNPFTALV